MPGRQLAEALAGAAAVGVLEKDISFGGDGGAVFSTVLAACARRGVARPALNFIGGLGGADISRDQVRACFADLERLAAGQGEAGRVVFLGIDDEEGGLR